MKKYVEAELEVIEFDAEDVITATCSPYTCPQDNELPIGA